MVVFSSPEEMVDFLVENKKIMMAYSIKNDFSFNQFANGEMSVNTSEKINNDFLLNLQNTLTEATGIKWKINIQKGPLGETLADKEAAKDRELKRDVMDLPLVKAIMAEFRGAKIDTLTRKIASQEDTEEEPSFFYEENTYFDEDN